METERAIKEKQVNTNKAIILILIGFFVLITVANWQYYMIYGYVNWPRILISYTFLLLSYVLGNIMNNIYTLLKLNSKREI